MDITRLTKIKEFQREYENLFQEKLVVDFELMSHNRPINQEETLRAKLAEFCQKYNLTVDDIMDRTKRISKLKSNERKVLVDYSTYVFRHNFSLELASNILQRDRTTMYYYAYKKKKLRGEVTS
ncbi:MAG: hypothetical protein WCP46_00120 [Alphaproteobacteria bacterium]